MFKDTRRAGNQIADGDFKPIAALATPTPMARVKANLFVNTWQGAIVVARASEGLEHIGRVFRYLKEILALSC